MSSDSFEKHSKIKFFSEEFSFPPDFKAELPPPGSLSLVHCDPESALLPPLPVKKQKQRIPKKTQQYPKLNDAQIDYIKKNFHEDGHYKSSAIPYEILVQNNHRFIMFPPGLYLAIKNEEDEIRSEDPTYIPKDMIAVELDGFLLRYKIWEGGLTKFTGTMTAYQLGIFPELTIEKLQPFLPVIWKDAAAKGYDTTGKFIDNCIGKGLQGEVRYGLDIDTGKMVAIKNAFLRVDISLEPFILRKLKRLAAFPKTDYTLNPKVLCSTSNR